MDTLYHRCSSCRLVTLVRNDGDRAFHARRCDGELAVDDRECQARLYHGPGHQSTTRCRLLPGHEGPHEAVYGGHSFMQWNGLEGITGFFDEPIDPEQD